MELRLSPAPKAMWGMTAFLPSEESALRFVRSARGESVEGLAEPPPRPVAIEFFNGAALDLLRRQRAENPAFSELPDLPESSHTAVYVEYHGDDEDAVADAVMAACDVLTALGGDEDATWVASDERERERLAAFRHATPEAVNLLIDERRKAEPSLTKLGTDMSVPDEHLERVMALYNNGLADAGLEAVIFGHIGDNHVHVNILPRTFEDYAKGKALYLAWAREVVEMGGSVSAEHGIGKLKPAMLKLMAGEDGIERMRALKRLFDPAETLNPGNLFGE
jgi:D-lactate dehydrogenase (cytochrome)